jgi:4-amino-4-deoxy-L-arabinose transferase-like glycosyltransferase
MKPLHLLGLICLGALALRLALLSQVEFPGIADPNHYYNMGVRLVEGHGFTIDYIWQYSLPPATIEHPEEHWMPLAAVLAAVPMRLFGIGVHAALLPFILIGALLPLLGYWGAAQLKLSAGGRLFAAACAAVLPEFVLNSLRTDTTIPAALFVCLSILLLIEGLRREHVIWFVGSGAAAGLAYLTRSDGALLVPMMLVMVIVYLTTELAEKRRGNGKILRVPLRLGLYLLTAALVISPWIARNLRELGIPTSPETRGMFFFTHHDDHYAYERAFTLQTLLAAQTPAQIIGKRVFEMAAGGQMMIEVLGGFLAVAVIGGGALLLYARDRERLLTLAPTLILLAGAFVAYTVFLPYKAQAGSLKKIFLALLPLLLPLAAYALERAVAEARIRRGAMVLAVLLLGLAAFQRVRTDAREASDYLGIIRQMAAVAQTLPDTNGDGDIRLMTQDPYILRFVGLRSVMYPYEDRDTILQVAGRYDIDYLLMPPNRPSLDALYTGAETDRRIVRITDVPGTPFAFFTAEQDEND